MKPWIWWPLWQRAVFTNAIGALGVFLGFALSGTKASPNTIAYTAVFTMALLNLMLLAVGQRIHSQKNAGVPAVNGWRVLYGVLTERPYVTALFVLQLLGVSRAVATAITLIQASTNSYVLSLPNAHPMSGRLMGTSVLLGGIAALWLLGAIGLWRNRSWAWWLALALNALAATVSAVLQLLKLNEFLLDPLAMAAVVLLFLRPVRSEFLGGTMPSSESPA